MHSFRKLLLILWKNWILQKRHFLISIIEIILPTVLSAVLVVLHSQGGKEYEVSYINEPTIYPVQPILGKTSAGSNGVYKLYYTPNNTMLNAMMGIAQFYSLQTDVNLKLIGVSSEDIILEANLEAYANNDSNFLGGIVFDDLLSNDMTSLKNLNYKLRFQTEFNTSRLRPDYTSPGPLNDIGINYFQSHFLAVQHIIAISYMQMITKYNDLFDKIQLYTQKFPYPPYYKDNGFSKLLDSYLPMFTMLSFLFTIPFITKSIVREKEKGIKELTQMMGLSSWIQWFGWFLSNLIKMKATVAIIVIFLCLPIGSSTAILHYSAPELVALFFLLYVACSILFAFLISSFFIQPTIATGATAILWLISFSIPYYIVYKKFTELSLILKLAVAILPNMSMCWIVKLLVGFEGRQIGIHWNNLSSPAFIGDNFTGFHLIGIMCFNIFIYSFLTWYVDNVNPGIFGVPKPWYFLFTKNYWIPSKPSFIEDIYSIRIREPNEYIEDDPNGLKVGIAIKNLIKRYGWLKKNKRAVNDISLNIYENQITALLGHNGAGKSTTISILTGMDTPTKGTAIINGFDIRNKMDQARESIGFCPQENVLFKELTVKEHLYFFGLLKGMSMKQLKFEVDTFLKKLQLETKSDAYAGSLSGGMKRKLNLGIALIGDSRVVMLDEPTSGLDPDARRAMWDLLHEMRRGRTILFTTHFMEEADALGDRIAIMANGKIKCVGSALFLKHKYGEGYQLNILKTDNCDEKRIFSLIKSFVPTAYLRRNIETELSYNLPVDYTPVFSQLFMEIEKNLADLGIRSFGVSVTTMEEVFLKAGKETNTEDKSTALAENQESQYSSRLDILSSHRFNKGSVLMFQQFYGLLMKYWHYGTRRWFIFILQISVPVAMVFLIFYLNKIMVPLDKTKVEPPLRMDLSPYDSSVVFYESKSETLGNNFKTTLPRQTDIFEENDIENGIIEFAKCNLRKYRERCIIGAVLSADLLGRVNATALYSSLFLNSLPTSVAQIHNALLQFYTNSTDWNINLQNAPLPRNPKKNEKNLELNTEFNALSAGIYVPNALAFLSSSFVILPILERTSKIKQLQLMTGVAGMTYWGSLFLRDFTIHAISSCLIIPVIHFTDSNDLYTSIDSLEIQALLLFLYGFSAIPFVYVLSFLFKLPASGYATILVLKMITGSIFSLLTYVFQVTDSLKAIADVIIWIFAIFPSYNVSIAFMYIARTSSQNKHCTIYDSDTLNHFCPKATLLDEIYPCCSNCKSHCLVKLNYMAWDAPGIGSNVMMLVVDCIIYFVILFLIEKGYLPRISYWIKNLRDTEKRIVNDDNTNFAIDTDVLKEKRRIYNLLYSGQFNSDPLIVDELTKKYGRFLAVDHLSFGVKTGECFGLLGINGAGKTTTFSMLTSAEVITTGDAFVNGASLKNNKYKIGYCPQVDALIEHLTAREILFLFARLRGILEQQIPSIVSDLIAFVGIERHANKITKVYSGGTKRKLNAAIALLGDPSIILLDEPTNGVDPASRHKFWELLTSIKNGGTSLVLTSHSMDECEALCNRIAIMVNGQFVCLGSPQYLKTKFGKGYTIIAKLSNSLGIQMDSYQTNLQKYIETSFNQCTLKDSHYGLVQYHVADRSTQWNKLFEVMEIAKRQYCLEDYSVCQTTLEQVFLSFARMQKANAREETSSV